MESKGNDFKDENIELENEIDIEDENDEKVEESTEENVVDDELLSEIESLKEANESLNLSLARLQADFSNYKKRTEKEKSMSVKLANEGLIMKLLPVIDDLERAYNHMESSEYSEGVEIIIKNFKEILKKEGLEEIESGNKPFDHNFHQAILMEQSEDVESGNIIETFQKGYTLNGKVIRPSMVKVSE